MVSSNIVQAAACICFFRQSLKAPDAQRAYVKWMRIMGFLFILPLAYIQFRRIFGPGDKAAGARLSMLKSFAVVNISWWVIYCTCGQVYHLPTEYWVSVFDIGRFLNVNAEI